jgi:hypothetical protein
MKKWFLTVFLVMTAFLLNAQYSPITINPSGNVVNTNATITFSNYSFFKTNVYFGGNTYTTNHAYDASGNLLDPEANEYVTASFVRSILNSDQFLFGTANTTNNIGFTNYDGTTNTIALLFAATPSTNYTKQFSNFVAGTYWASVISTNTFQSVSGPYVNDIYVNLDSDKANPNPGPTFTMMPDIYATYDRTNLILLAAGAAQPIVYHNTNLYTWIQSSPQYTSTNAAGFYIVRRVKCDSFTIGGGNANPVINVFGGSNYITSVAFNTPVVINANYYGTFIGNGSGLTNIPLSGLQSTPLTNNPSATSWTNNIGIYGNGSGLTNIPLSGLQSKPLTNNPSATSWTNNIGIYGNGIGLTNLNPASLSFLVTTQMTAVLNFNLAEIAITNNITFTSATGVASNGYVKYIGATVWGTNITVSWPQIWSPNNTNIITLTNGLVAFKCFGSNIFAAYYQP